MKELQLWLATAFLCCAALGQSPTDLLGASSRSEAAPVFSFFTVSSENGHALLRWAAPPLQSEDFFIVEKSSDARHFEMLSAMDASAGLDSVFSLVDNAVGSGTISYRIRITGKDGKERCSKTVNMMASAGTDFRFYPNPVDKLLIIRSTHALSIQIVDIYGSVLFGQELDSGMQIVNVSTLAKGNYILKATDKSNNTVISEQLVKNN